MGKFKRKGTLSGQINKLCKKEKTHLQQYGEAHPSLDPCEKLPKYKKVEDVQSDDEAAKIQDNSSNTEEESEEEQVDKPSAYHQLLSSFAGCSNPSQDNAVMSDEDEESEDSYSSDDLQAPEDPQNAQDTVLCDGQVSDEENNSTHMNENDHPDNENEDIDDEDINENLHIHDSFSTHFETVLEEDIIEKLNDKALWQKSQIKVSSLGKCVQSKCTSIKHKMNIISGETNLKKLAVKHQIINQLAVTNKKYTNAELKTGDGLTSFQQGLFSVLNTYQDFYYPERSLKDGEDIRLVYCIHALNHVLKTRSRIIAHNNKLKEKEHDTSTVEYRDQGLTRPKVLILLPFRESAKRVVNILLSLLSTEDKLLVAHKKRFTSDYSSDREYKYTTKPDGYNELFSGNIDDHFRMGIGVSKKSIKLYAKFYEADIILASPLGLRTIIGSAGEKDRDFDFLSSIELLILDQADIFLMQNWEHILHFMKHLHVQPKQSHGADFSRIREWTLNGWAKYYRQTVIFSDISKPELNALFNKCCHNWAGKLLVPKSPVRGTICQIVTQLPQVFKIVEVDTYSKASDARFDFFMSKMLELIKDMTVRGKFIYMPSYFDFVRIRNFLKKEQIDFVHINEYSKEKNLDRSRGLFFHGKVRIMLYTERFHFYRRLRIRGIKNLIFYELPNYPEYYSEICNMLKDPKKDTSSVENLSCTVFYTKYDAQKLAEIVGTERAGHMITSEKPVHMFVTGDT